MESKDIVIVKIEQVAVNLSYWSTDSYSLRKIDSFWKIRKDALKRV